MACEEQQEAAGAIIMASEERMQCATSTSRLQHTAKLGVCGEKLQLTEATIVACEEQQEAAGAIIMASEERIKTATRYRKSRLCGKML